MNILVTGSNGLIGSNAVEYYDSKGHNIIGIDNNMRREFFGPEGDTLWNLKRLLSNTNSYTHFDIDIRDRELIFDLFKKFAFDIIIHCAAQPSHDMAAKIPFLDFEVNALGTLNLLEATRQCSPDAIFIHMSTNKVYGDAPNEYELIETETRFDYSKPEDFYGINENCRIDQTLHSLFGASKTAGDIVAQEYGRYFNLKTGIFRGGCLTGSSHSGVELHGFLSYLIHAAVIGKQYTIYGYKGKQVRDQIHSSDVVSAFDSFINNPRPGEVYNLGGGRENSASVLECINLIEQLSNYKVNYIYNKENRIGDHICYISDLRKIKSHFPEWSIKKSLSEIITEMVHAEETQILRSSKNAYNDN